MFKKLSLSSANMHKKAGIIVVIWAQITAFSSEIPRRIDTVSVVQGESFHLEMVPGLGTLLNFPCDVERAILGNQTIANIILTEKFPRELVVTLVSGTTSATNLIVTCVNNKNPFVFDVDPNPSHHRDVVIINRQVRKISSRAFTNNVTPMNKTRAKRSPISGKQSLSINRNPRADQSMDQAKNEGEK